ncbi:MAG TPA: glycosyltransferase family 39 protein [Thermoanaerobaculia bacterium]|jgi:hypothetical protein|nr:glycosyltransferase family 39 protein [Thermoanaerobaculia bacterium]
MNRAQILAGVGVLLVATAVRLPAVTGGLPYASYIDEGHVLHHVVHLLAARTWEPDTYSYPSLPFYTVAAAAVAYSPVYAALHDRPLRQDLSEDPARYYDIVEPTELMVLGRLITLAFSLGTVVMTGLLAWRVAGPAAGLFAAWLAALVPGLVARSAIVNVNPMACFFVLGALLFAEGARDGSRPRRDAMLAGAMSGLAAATKYPAALVFLSVVLALLIARIPWRERWVRLLLASGAAAAALLLAMPALLLRTGKVLAGLREMSIVYSLQEAGSYWDQAIRRAEWDLPLEHPEVGITFLLLAGAGLVVGLLDSRWRSSVWGWLLFGAVTGLLVVPYKFRAFRNLLALVPLACVLAGLFYARIWQWFRRPLAVALAAAVLPVLLFAPALHSYIDHQLRLEDSREQAIRWLDEHAGPHDRVLFSQELAILPSRIASLQVGEIDVQRWALAKERIRTRRYHYVVLGELTRRRGGGKIPLRVRDWIFSNYFLAAKFGHYPTAHYGGLFNGNGQVIYVLKQVSRKVEKDRTAVPAKPHPRPLSSGAGEGGRFPAGRADRIYSARPSSPSPAPLERGPGGEVSRVDA